MAPVLLLGLAVLLPVLALLGFYQQGRTIELLAQQPEWRAQILAPARIGTAAERDNLIRLRDYFLIFYAAAIALVFAARGVRLINERRGGMIRLTYPDRAIRVPKGLTVLEASYRHHVPHANVCGGKGRCSTCRIRIVSDLSGLPQPSAREAFVLERVGAGADPAVRLACQLRPSRDITIIPLLPPQVGTSFVHGKNRVHSGEERYIVSMFVDDRYDERQTQDRLDRIRLTTSGATTCKRFHQENPETCEACHHWQKIKSPIALCRRNDQTTTATCAVPSSQSGDAELDVEIRRLSGLPPALYEHERKLVADKFGIRTTVLDKLVNRVRDNGADERQGHALQLTEIEPWPDTVDGGELLHDIVREMRRYVVMPEDDAITAALWVLHSYIFDVFTCTPRLCITSPEKGCGKTTLLDVISCLINRPLAAVDVTGAAIFRTIEALQPTVLFDEADNTFNRTANGNGTASDILAILNSGHRFGGQVIRTVGDDHEPRIFRTHAPVVIALIGRAPGTLDDRSVHIRLRRKHSGERADRFRNDRTQPLQSLARRARRWSEDRRPDVAVRDPDMPDDMFNRAADNWRPLRLSRVIRILRSNVADLERQHCPEKDTLQTGRSVDLKEIADPFESHHGNFTRKASGAQILERLAPI
jgi:ferredoxin